MSESGGLVRVTLVHVHVKQEHLGPFIAATRRNHEGSVREPGNLRFDVLQSEDDPTRFVLVEIFQDDAAVEAHKATMHYLAWRSAVAEWMASPREAHRFHLLTDPAPRA